VTILIVGQAAQQTGLARVTRAIADHLAPRHEIHVLGIDGFGPRGSAQTEGGWTLHRNPTSYDIYAELRLTELVDEIRPATVILYNDLWVVSRYFSRLDRATHRTATVGYCPVDGRILFPHLISALAPLDALSVFTRFARSAVLEAAARQGLDGQKPFRSISVIPHGLDARDFHPWPPAEKDADVRRTAARRALFPDRPELWDGFWVLNANRNQPRKRLDLTLEGFARFAAGKPACVRLYLHTGLKEIGIDILKHARRLDIADRLILKERGDGHPELPTSELNLVYNACDVGVNTATGEGWGLVSCEHAATGAPQIVPRHSACAEIWDGAAELLTPVGEISDGLLGGSVIAPDDLAGALERLYGDPAHYRRLGRAAYRRATDKQYRWGQAALRWELLLGKLHTRAAARPRLAV
jgi:glycosyltransferase involved in cell wall biosynthesis